MRQGLVTYIPDSLWQDYYARIAQEAIHPENVKKAALRVVYSRCAVRAASLSPRC